MRCGGKGINAEFAEDAESAEGENANGRRRREDAWSERRKKRLVTSSPTAEERFESLEFMGRTHDTKESQFRGCQCDSSFYLKQISPAFNRTPENGRWATGDE
jgi:hypothetical protein